MKLCRDFRVRLVCVILFIAAVVATVGSLQWFINYMYDTGQGVDVVFENYKHGYTETNGFQKEFVSEAGEVIQGIKAKELFETDGKYDGNKIVDPKQYSEKNTIDGSTDCGISYTLDDFLQLGENLYNEGSYKTIYVCKKKKVDKKGNLYAYLTEDEFEELLDSSDFNNSLEDYEYNTEAVYNEEGSMVYSSCWPFSISKSILETPVQEGSWLEVFNTNPELNGLMSDYVDMIDPSAQALSSIYSMYQQRNTYEDARKTNLRYILYNKSSKKLYSNNPDWQDSEQYKTYLNELQTQQIYLYKDGNGWEDNLTDTVEGHSYLRDLYYNEEGLYDTSDWETGFTVDTTFAADDVFANQAISYTQYASDAESFRAVLAISILVVLVCVILLTFGFWESDGKTVRLFTFDKLKTEIAAVIIVGVWGIFFGTGVAMIANFTELLESYIFWGAMLSIPSAVFFLIGYGSLIKRLRAHTLWKNSICCIIWKWCRKFLSKLGGFLQDAYHNFNLIWKYSLGMLAVIFLHWLAMADDSGLFIFIAVITEGVVFIMGIRDMINRQKIIEGLRAIVSGKLEQKIDTTKMKGTQKEAAELLNHVEDGLEEAFQKQIKSERMKTELITNVSHDIKTPLTSIINYVDLLKRETAEIGKADQNKVTEYLEVLDQKSQRLKILTEDVVEASKISSGNIVLENTKLDLVETLIQIEGEYSEKFSESDLSLVKRMPDPPVTIFADGRRVWRVFGNLYQNVAKYAMPNTRVYVSLAKENGKAVFTMKNISEAPLNIDADELTERFIRGDESRTTEGSGLGLSIAKSLTETMNGKFDIYLDGDLFKVIVVFPLCI